MAFTLQVPGVSDLLNAISKNAKRATKGGAMFAFATLAGIKRLFSAGSITAMLKRGDGFHLIVGVDAITNIDALSYLEAKARKYPTLKVSAFLHNQPGTFHPKLCWFRNDRRLILIIGSGNLTTSGLGIKSSRTPSPGNWEAFATQTTVRRAVEYQRRIEEWVAAHEDAGIIRSVDDSDVIDQAMENGQVRFTAPERNRRQRRLHTIQPSAPVIESKGAFSRENNDVLIRELPRNRTGQADLGRKGLEFLGFRGRPVDVYLQYVSLSDVLSMARKQRLFKNASQNYRVEMHEVTELGYDVAADGSRMLLVAVRLTQKSCRYTLVPITHPDYPSVSQLLGARKGNSMRMLVCELGRLKAAWTTAPRNLIPIDAPLIE